MGRDYSVAQIDISRYLETPKNRVAVVSEIIQGMSFGIIEFRKTSNIKFH